MAFNDYVAELKGYVPSLSPFLSQKFINRAWSDIRDSDDWSFLESMSIIQIPALVSTGAITFSQFQNTITCNAAASAALTPLIGAVPVSLTAQTNSAGQPLIGTGYQIRMTSGPLYSIISADVTNPAAIVLTVDRIINEPSQTAIGYQAYRAYIGAPSLDFLSWTSVTNVAEGYVIRGRRLSGTQDQLNAVDPQRDSTEDMYFMFTLYADANGMPVKEAWPGPVNQQGYIGMYKRRGQDLSATNDIPGNFPVNCLMERAKMYAAQFQATQKRISGDDTNWQETWKMHRENYERPIYGELANAKKKDTSLRTPAPIIRRGAYANFPFSSQFCANHDVMRMLSAYPGFFGTGGWY